MANLTYYSANLIGNRILGGTTLTVPSNYYLGVSTTATQKDGTGITEPTDASYSRVSIQNNKTNFSNSNLGTINNLVEFQFPESTISWGVVTHWFLSDALSGGNIWFQGNLISSRNVESSTVLVLPIGAFDNTVE